ncbi:Lrp/AsnC family transcriptional regulator, partial [Candidatus Micrarchaeota archaeon]|nr:Lrp/AsnC family transcriptional regulator [Candidatus Micrarchaeota archaeon]
MDLDKLDKQILFELDVNARVSNKELAKRCVTSEPVVAYRIKRLCAQGRIKYFYTMINGAKLGLLYFRIFVRLQNTSPEAESEIIETLRSSPFTTWVASVRGKYNLVVSVYAYNIEHFSKLYNALTKKFDKNILTKNICVVQEVGAFGRPFLVGKKSGMEISVIYGGVPQKIELAKTDASLLFKLSKNARASIIELSKATGINPETLRYRIKKLQQVGIIIGFRALPDLKQTGHSKHIISLYLFSTTSKRLKELTNFCAAHPNIIFSLSLIG